MLQPRGSKKTLTDGGMVSTKVELPLPILSIEAHYSDIISLASAIKVCELDISVLRIETASRTLVCSQSIDHQFALLRMFEGKELCQCQCLSVME